MPSSVPAEIEKLLLSEVNFQRVGVGVPALRTSAILDRPSQSHAEDMAHRKRLGHDGSNGSTFISRVVEAGYPYASIAENVAETWLHEPVDCVRAWMGSPGHKKNMLSSDYTEAGVGVAVGSDGVTYWCLLLAKPAVVRPKPFETPRSAFEKWLLRLLRLIPVFSFLVSGDFVMRGLVYFALSFVAFILSGFCFNVEEKVTSCSHPVTAASEQLPADNISNDVACRWRPFRRRCCNSVCLRFV